MQNSYLLELINEAKNRGGGMILNSDNQPAVVVLTIEKYNELIASGKLPVLSSTELLQQSIPATSKIKHQKVLVTGGAGYIGGHLVYELIRDGYEVVILDNLSTGKRENLHAEALFIEGDLFDDNLLRDIFSAHKIDAVFHMAASLEVEESVKFPDKYLQNNVANTIKLLQVMAESGVKNIIFSSTAAVYGENGVGLITESSPLKPNNPYGVSKLQAERVIKYYCDFLGFKAVIFRYFNACGFNLSSNILPTHGSHLIYNVLQVAKGAKPHLEVFGNDYETFDGTCIRDYVHVSDIVLPHIQALKKLDTLENFQIYNIGTGKGCSVEQVVTTASEVLNKIIPMQVAPRRPGDAPITVADNSKLLNNLGYKLQFSHLENMIQTSWEVIKKI